MKNKKVTYLLIAAVMVVWGLIIYRIFITVGANDEEAPAVAAAPRKYTLDDYVIPKDTTKLLLNYRDPFGIAKVKDTAEMPVSKLIHQQVVKPALPAINWGFIQYAGYMRNVGSKKLIAMVIINGKSRVLAEGEAADGVKLIKNLKDSIKVSFNGKTRFIVLKSATL